MSKFYNEIAEIYSKLFPLSEKKIEFLIESAKKSGGIDVLDVACGDGKEGKALIERGYNVVGLDMEPSMIEEAIENGLDAEVLDMLKIDELHGDYDFIYSVGNSIPHLNSMDEVITFLEKAYQKLKNDGVIVIQNINFNRFWRNDAIEGEHLGDLPTIKGDDYTFVREYYRRDMKIGFKTLINYKDKHYINEVELLPIDPYKLADTMIKIGFKDLELYGNFSKAPMGEGNAAVIRARKLV